MLLRQRTNASDFGGKLMSKRIYDIETEELLENPDLEQGYLSISVDENEETIYYYIKYTPQQLAENERLKKEAEETEAKRQAEQEQMTNLELALAEVFEMVTAAGGQ